MINKSDAVMEWKRELGIGLIVDDSTTSKRSEIKEGLSKCTAEQKRIFKLMYSSENPDADINYVVDNMEKKKLNWAFQQVNRSLVKNGEL